MNDLDKEALALRAIQQSRILAHQAAIASRMATHQAVTLLHDTGLSQREISRLTGLSKSDVNRKVATRAVRDVAVAPNADVRVYDFADEWIWGSAANAATVRRQLT